MDEVYLPGISFTGDIHIQGDMFNIHDNQSVTIVHSGELKREPTEEPVEVPAELAESDLWKKVQEAGMVDAEGRPTVSRTEAALMANELAERLDITHKWKLFEALWHRKNMRGDYNTALEQRKSLLFQEKLKKLFR